MNLLEEIAKLDFRTQILRASDCRELERIAGADICGKHHVFLPANTLHITEGEHTYLIMLKEGQLTRLELPNLNAEMLRPMRMTREETP